MSLGRFIDDAAASVRGLVPGVDLGRLALLQEGHAVRRGDKVLVAHSAALNVGIIEEELVVLRGDLAQNTSAAQSVRRGSVNAHKAGIHEVRALGQACVDLAHAGFGVLRLVHGQGHSAGEAAHGVAGDADDAVSVLVLQNVGLLINILHGVIHGIEPERQPHAEKAAVGIILRIQTGMAVVVLVKGQHHKAPAGQLNGIGVLHFRRVQIPVGHDDRGLGVVG